MALTTVTVLFTDVVGSTELMSRVGEAAADELRREHFDRLRRVIGSTGGREVKNLGDGLMVVFEAAASALTCAAGMQQAMASTPIGTDQRERVEIRVGVASGEADTEDGDYFGVPVVEAARLCGAAGAGEVLVSELTRLLVRSRGGFDLEPVGPLELKGLPGPVDAARLRWEPATPEVAALPPALSALRSGSFVGRTAERALLADALKHVRAGERRGVLISGEPGLGKSTLAAMFAGDAAADGATVVYGRCDEDLRIPYQPWIEALSELVGHASPEVVAAHVQARGHVLGRLVPGLAVADRDAAPSTTDDENERHAMFAAVVDLLHRAGADAPVVVVLDDLHWADPGTVQLLRWVLNATADSRLMVTGTFRDSDIDADHPLSSLLAELHRRPGVDRLPLSGLGDVEVLALLETLAGHEMTNDGLRLRDALLAETGGNPFFVGELLRHLSESGAIRQGDDGRWAAGADLPAAGLPVSIREVIGKRTRWLGPDTHRVLSVAAVIGRDFDLDVLTRVVDLDEDRLVDLCDRAVAAAMLHPSERVDGYSFAHALIEHTLYDELSPTRRARTHRSVAEAIEELCGGDPGRRVGELARHWRLATRPADTAKAVTYARLAGDRALESLAAADAARWYRDAWDLMPEAQRHTAEGCELLIALGTAELRAGYPTYRDTAHAAGRLAIDLDRPDLVVRAALGLRNFNDHFGTVIQESVDLLEAALGLVGEHDSPERALLLARLAGETLHSASGGQRFDAARDAVAMAERLGDVTTLTDIMPNCLDLDRRDEGDDQWYRLLVELLGTLAVRKDRDDESRSGANVVQHAVAFGDDTTFHTLTARCIELASQLRTPHSLASAAMCAVQRAHFDGDPDALEAAAMRYREVHIAIAARPGSSAGARMAFVLGAFIRGTLDQILDAIAASARHRPDQPIYPAVHAWALAVSGHPGQAAALGTPPDVWRDTSSLVVAVRMLRAETAARCGDAQTSRTLIGLLAPCRNQIATTLTNPIYAVAHATGIARACVGDLDGAVADLEHAIAIHERWRAPFHTAYSRTALADVLTRRATTGDLDRAQSLANAATDVARERSYGYVLRDAAAVLQRLG
jgi:class 3 adenylate cyclase